ncbi:MAG: nucleotidyl transferase AbiEii/AbiGii toxin family protein [Wenzhouxiangella sp.]|nr:nucleotidyl transferase AbiEii/AbiGii toxin family protein [Wenzhouxiangella sp.]
MKPVKNMAASVHQRLLNKARSDQRPFNELLQYFAMERFLYRLSRSPHATAFILKGALMLRTWGASEYRPTMDIDMLGMKDYEEASTLSRIREIMQAPIEDDGLLFDPQSIQADQITENNDYKGIRIRFRGALGNARINMQIDVGFGDVVYPKAKKSEFPTLLEFPSPNLLCYTRESAVAEKFQAMVKLGLLNSRMKDFFDIWVLCRQFEFSGSELAEAVRLTFDKRETRLPEAVEAFGEAFIDAKQTQWAAFRKQLRQDYIPESLKEVVTQLEIFLYPICHCLRTGQNPPHQWTAPGPWSE